MIIPEAYQIEHLVRFLRLALRIDPVCLAQLSATPDEICTGALEIEPFNMTQEGLEPSIADIELPCLCIREMSSDDIFAGGCRGFKGNMKLWYVFRPPIGDRITKLHNEGETAGDGTYHKIPDWAAADRWMRTVWWRLQYWLDTHSITYTVSTGPPLVQSTWDLLDQGQIWDIGQDRSAQYKHQGGLAVLETSFDISYVLPPYEAADAADFDHVEFVLTQQQEAPIPDGPAVSSEVTL